MSSVEVKKTILVVDDEDINLDLMQGILEDHYEVECFTRGENCLQRCNESPVDLVLLDVEMPEMDGLEVCRRLHDIQPQCPVMFISSKTSNEERLAGYAAGGYDYIAKPCEPQLLLAKILLIIQQQEQHKKLDERRRELSKAFMDIASGSGEMGVLLKFSVNVFSVKSYQELADLVLMTLQEIGSLSAAVLVCGQQEAVSRTNMGPCSPIEEEVLVMLKERGRIYEFNDQIQVNEPYVSALIKSMPDDELITGRMKEHIPLLLKIASACAEHLDLSSNLNLDRKVVKTVQNACDELVASERLIKMSMLKFTADMEGKFQHLQDSVQYLSITEAQENCLVMTYASALEQALNSAQEVTEVGNRLNRTISGLKSLL